MHSEWSLHSTGTAPCTEQMLSSANGNFSILQRVRQILPPLVFHTHSFPGALRATPVDFLSSSRCSQTDFSLNMLY